MPIRIPIQFLNDALQPASRPHGGRPIALMNFYTLGTQLGEVVPITQAWALFDTGADLNYADESFVHGMNWPVETSTMIVGATGSTPGSRHAAGISIGPLENSAGVATQVCTLPDRHDGTKPYRVILGNLFMELGHLHMNYVEGEFWFDFYSSAERAARASGAHLRSTDPHP